MTDLHEVYVEATKPNIDVSRYRPQLEAALSYASATHSYDDVASMIAAGHATFWPGPASCIVTEFVEYPQKRAVHFFLAAGNSTELEAMVPIVLDWAKSKGCISASFIGRKGWLRSFVTRLGWRDTGLVVMEKAL